MNELFELAAGSVRGKDHEFSRKQNQDAYRFVVGTNYMTGVICDGCGDPSSPHSDIGAWIAAKVLLTCLSTFNTIGRQRLELVRRATLNTISSLVADMSIPFDNEDMHRNIRDHFLFTSVCFYIDKQIAYFFSIGDGTLWVNGEQILIGPFPNNAPPYMCYSLMDSSLLSHDPGCLKFQMRKEIPTEQLESFMVGCDGVLELASKGTSLMPNGREHVGSIDQFWVQDKYFVNPEAINRKLYLMNKEVHTDSVVKHGLLHDDTTMICGRRV